MLRVRNDACWPRGGRHEQALCLSYGYCGCGGLGHLNGHVFGAGPPLPCKPPPPPPPPQQSPADQRTRVLDAPSGQRAVPPQCGPSLVQGPDTFLGALQNPKAAARPVRRLSMQNCFAQNK